MAIDLNKIKARLAGFDKKTKVATNAKAKECVWKPVEGKQTIRIVPYQHQVDNPFIELKWHYDFGGKTYLSPSSINKPDPICELAAKLKKNQDTWKQGANLEPKLRTYVPIIIRGEEEKGVKFWSFGVTIFKQLMATITEPDYGDITDLNQGYDIVVDYLPKEKSKKKSADGKQSFPETSIFVKPKPRPAIDPTNPNAKTIMDLITTKQPNLLDVYEVSTYETLSAALDEYLSNGSSSASTENDNDPVVATTTSTSTRQTQSPSAEKATENTGDVAEAFENLFNS